MRSIVRLSMMFITNFYRDLPEDLQDLIHAFNDRHHRDTHADRFRGVLGDLTDSRECLWKAPSPRLLVLVDNAAEHCLQPGYTGLERHVNWSEVTRAMFERSPRYRFSVCCPGCERRGAFPCRNCSRAVLGGAVKKGVFVLG